MHQEYPNVTEEESICKSAQETLNIIIDYNRETYQIILQDEFETDKNLIDKVSSSTWQLTWRGKILNDLMPLYQGQLTNLQ